MKRKRFALLILAVELSGETFSVDCSRPEWRDLSSLNSRMLKPGDRVLFKSGCVWQGQLVLKGSGEAGKPIVIDRYGKGAMPRIEANGRFEDAVLVKNQEWIEMRNLEVTNQGEGIAVRRGVHVWLDDFGTARHVVVSGMYVHDVNGDNKIKDNGGIIWRTSGRVKPSRFDGLVIAGNIVWKVDRSAIAAQSAFWRRSAWFPSVNVVIRDNYAGDIGGDGIVPWASDGALVEHNIVRDCNRRANTYNAGIWPWSCDNTVMRLNEASWTRTQMDGQGFDSDYNSKNTVIEWNYSHDNEGGFLLICTDGGSTNNWHAGNVGVTVRNNISRNDGVRTFHLSGPAEKVRVHDNAVYTAAGGTVNVVQFSTWRGYARDVEFRNNLFAVAGTARYGHEVSRSKDGNFVIGPGFGPAQDVRFVGNIYLGFHQNRPEDTAAKVEAEIPRLKWEGPQFDPARPEEFRTFIRAHRKWLVELMEGQFGRSVE